MMDWPRRTWHNPFHSAPLNPGVPMPIALTCSCGRALRVKDELAGRKIRCPKCSAVVAVPRPPAEQDAEAAALDLLLADSPAEERVAAAPPSPPPAAREQAVRPPAPPAPKPPVAWATSKPATADKPPSVAKSRKSSRRRGPILVVHPSIVTGVLMMAGALVWFVLGLMFGWIYFYPPVLFVLGIGAVLRGLRGEQ